MIDAPLEEFQEISGYRARFDARAAAPARRQGALREADCPAGREPSSCARRIARARISSGKAGNTLPSAR
jgi:hypothetical protein